MHVNKHGQGKGTTVHPFIRASLLTVLTTMRNIGPKSKPKQILPAVLAKEPA